MVATTDSHIVTSVEAVVTRTNGNGFKVEGREGWLNFSKFAVPAPAMPSEGQRVVIGLDKGGFVRSIEPVVSEAASAPEPAQIRGAGAQGTSAGPRPNCERTRLAVLQAAAAYCQYRTEATPEDVISIAERWLTWAAG